MGKDVIRIFMTEVNLKTLHQQDATLWKSFKKVHWVPIHPNDTTIEYKRRQERYLHGTMSTDSGCIHVEYLRSSPVKGDLLLTVSVAEIYNGNNSIPISNIDITDLIHRIIQEIRFVLDVSQLPPSRTWRISRDETNLDLIDTVENNKIRFDIFMKSKLPYMKIDLTLAGNGTVYFYTGKTRKRAGMQVCIYSKRLQQDFKNNNLREMLGLTQEQDVMRCEVKMKRQPLKNRVQKTNKSYGFQEGNGSNLETVLSKEFQIFVISELFIKLGFDKTITTKKKLNQIIDDCQLLSQKRKITCKRAIRFLNKEIKTINLSTKTLAGYKKIILATGYHYLYAAKELAPINLDDIKESIDLNKSMMIQEPSREEIPDPTVPMKPKHIHRSWMIRPLFILSAPKRIWRQANNMEGEGTG